MRLWTDWQFAFLVAAASAVSFVPDVDPRVFAQPSRPAFRTTVDLVSLNVTVLNGTRQYIGDLGQSDFVVLENGIPQHVTYFATTTVPLAVALLLDSSASMEKALPLAQEAAVRFARTIRPQDLATVIDFDSRVETAASFTHDSDALEKGIRGTVAGGATALYNAVYVALNELKKVTVPVEENAIRRRAIVLLSDGDDTASLVAFEEVLDAASRLDTVIYTIGLGSPQHSPAPVPGGPGAEGQFVLRRLAEQTGGRAFFPSEAKELAGIYSLIREELSKQYSLAYESSNSQKDGAWRRIGVRVNRPSAIVRTKQGYFAPRK
jgi:Ca-activated chloride channel family protein